MWPTADALAQEIWGAVEDHDAQDWKRTQLRIAWTGGGEGVSKSWSGPGVEDDDDEPASQGSEPKSHQIQTYPEDPHAAVTLALSHIINSVGFLGREMSVFTAQQNKALGRQDEQINRLLKTIEKAMVDRWQLMSAVSEAEAQAVVATEGQAAVQADLEEAKSFQAMLGTIGVAAGTKFAADMVDPEKTGEITLKKILSDDAVLKKLLKSPSGEALKKKLMTMYSEGDL